MPPALLRGAAGACRPVGRVEAVIFPLTMVVHPGWGERGLQAARTSANRHRLMISEDLAPAPDGVGRIQVERRFPGPVQGVRFGGLKAVLRLRRSGLSLRDIGGDPAGKTVAGGGEKTLVWAVPQR